MTDISEELAWLRQLFEGGAGITWADLREKRRLAGLSRRALREALWELEFAGELECDRSGPHSESWIWRRKATAHRGDRTTRPDLSEDRSKAIVDRAELLGLLDSARRITHPDVSKASNAHEVTARLNEMVDRLRGR